MIEHGDRTEIRALTGLRIAAALWVMLLHLRAELLGYLPGIAFLRPFLEGGDLGVDIFFTLSGFVLSYQYLERIGPRLNRVNYLNFVRLRIARVYPIHFLTLQVAVAFALLAELRGQVLTHELRTPSSYVQNLLLVQAWFGEEISWNGPAWSVSAEWFAYLLFPLAAVAVYRATRSWHFALGVLVPMVFAGLIYSGEIPYLPDVDSLHALLRIAVAFTIGCFLYRIHRSVPVPDAVAAALPLVSIVLIVAGTYVPDLNPAVELIPTSGLILGLAYGLGPVSRLLATGPAVYGGTVSYSLYMIHGLVFGAARSLLIPRIATAGLPLRATGLAAIFGVSFGAAAVLYHFVEEPARKWIRRRRSARQPTAA